MPRVTTGPKVLLHRAVHISSTSVFLVPMEGEALDFQTVNSVPPAHRGFLQKNGCIVRLIFSLSVVTEDVCTREGRLKIWWNALVGSGLVERDASSVTMPSSFSSTPWPIVDDNTFTSCMAAASKRHQDAGLKECPFVLPVLSVQQFCFKDRGIRGKLGAIWMPRYRHNLLQWSEKKFSRQCIPETTLGRLLNQLTIALLALSDVRKLCPSCIGLEDVLVDGDDEEGGKPIFILNALECHLPKQLDDKLRKSNGVTPVLAPEFIHPLNKPLSSIQSDVWALGMIVYQVACGLLSLKADAARLSRRGARQEEQLPLNHSLMTPSDISNRVRRDLQSGAYSNPFIHLVILMLGQDPLTRPTLRELDHMLHDIFRYRPILRFPFALGPFDLIRLPFPDNVVVNPASGRYVIHSRCVLCGKNRTNSVCVRGEHTPASCSPLWSTDEPLPGYMVRERSQMTYLFPIVGNIENKEHRQRIETALKGDAIDTSALLQLFGGYAILQTDKQKALVTREVMVPIPCNVLRKKEQRLVATRMSFTAAMPWPSECTSKLQQEGRIHRAVPMVFGIRNVRWYAWILPGEKFQLNGKLWVPAPDGAFVFWFNDLLHPSELDRYFLVCGVSSLTLQAKVECNVLPDHCFKRKSSNSAEDSQHPSRYDYPSMHSITDERGVQTRANHQPVGRQAAARRSTIISLVDSPEAMELSDMESEGKPISRRASGNNNNNNNSTATTTTTATTTAAAAAAAAAATTRKVSMGEGLTNRQRRISTRGKLLRMKSIDDITPGKLHDIQNNTPDVRSPVSLAFLAENPSDTDSRATEKKFYEENKMINRQLSAMVDGDCGLLSTGGGGFGEMWPFYEAQQCHRERSVDGNMTFISAPRTTPIITNSAHEGDVVIPVLDTMMPEKQQNNGSHSKAVKSALKVFGCWHPSWCIDAAFRSLTFFIPDTGEHGRLSVPVNLSTAMRFALHAPNHAASMAFCSNEIPIMRRNHPHCEKTMSLEATNGIIPHHALVFYDEEEKVIGLLGLRFAVTSYPNLTVGEFLLQFSTLPPVPTTAFMASQLGAAYFSGTALFEGPLLRKTLCGAKGGNFISHTPGVTSSKAADGIVSASQPLTMSSAGLASFCYPHPPASQSDDDALPFCWVGFDVITRMLMLADVQQQVWHPLYLSGD